MKYCTYKMGDQKFNSYGELLEYIRKIYVTDKLDVTDLVFSKTVKKDAQVKRIEEIKQENIEEISNSLIDGEPFLKDRYSVSLFINDDLCNIEGHRLVTKFDINNYKSRKIELLILNGTDEETARELVQRETDNWPKIAEDGVWIHKVVNNLSFLTEDSNDYINKLNNIPERLNNNAILADFHQQLRKKYISEKGKYADSTAFLGLTIKSKLDKLDKDIFGKINWLFVDLDGILHLYLVKVSSQNPRNWIDIKQENYKYDLAFIKLMLANNGINVEGIDLNIIPVLLIYDPNYNKVSSVKIHELKNYSTRNRGPLYAMDKYEKQASSFIKSNFIPFNISSEPIKRALEVSRAIFPTLNLKETGLGTTAIEWIKRAPTIDPTNSEPLVIKLINDRDYAYEVIINGKSYKIESGEDKEKNEKIILLVTEHLKELHDNRNYSTHRIKEAIRDSFKKGFMTFSEIKGLRSIAHNLEGLFSQYIMDYTVNSVTNEKIFNYTLIDDYLDNNVIIFKDNRNGTLHFIALTTYSINGKVNLEYGSRILSAYRLPKDDLELEANFGNIEAVRTMELINEILPSLGDVRLGSLSVVGLTDGASLTFNIGEFNRNYFLKIIKEVNLENEGLNIKNNFSSDSVNLLDPVTELIEKLNFILQGRSPVKDKISSESIDELQDAKTQETQKSALINIIRLILFQEPSFSNPELVEKYRRNGTVRGDLAELYNIATKALMYLYGVTPTRLTSFSDLYARGLTPMTIPDSNLRSISEWLQITHDLIATEFTDMYNRYLYSTIFDFYKLKGYTSFENITIGDSRRVYRNLFERDNNGNLTMKFKNPYDNSNDLNNDERKFLKEVLFLIAKINTNWNFPYSSGTDSRLADYVKQHPEYLWVPLLRASKSSSRLSLNGVKAKLRNTFKRISHFSQYFDEFVNEGLLLEERLLIGEGDFYNMHINNIYELSLPSSTLPLIEVEKKRAELLEKYTPDFFETNIENILVDFLAKQISITQFNKFLVCAKAFVYLLHLTGEFNGNKNIVEKEKKWINDYIKINTFNTSIMSEMEKKIVGIITPFKRVTNHLLLAGNVVSCLRDVFQGVLENFMRSFIKLNTDITPSEVAKAYAYVHTHSTSNAMAQNLLSRLCQVYRISNMDVGKIAERIKTDRNGILNIENRMYSTLRSPDFLNRMTLFVARCMHDGSWDAFSLDSKGQLKYDWTKDKRFSAYKTAPKDSDEYKKAKSAYLSAIRQYNLENPDHQITPDEGLPSPYSNIEMNAIRGLADNIYGAYDRSKRIMAENEAYGYSFLTFITWMNGQVNTYFMPAQRNNTSRLKQEQVIDDKGRPLFYDEYCNITTENTGVPVYAWVPAPVQGILPLMRDLYRLMHKDGYTVMKEYIKGDDYTKAALRKIGTDALHSLLMSLLFKLILAPMYKDHKKNIVDNPILINLLVEVIYKAGSRSYDTFMGPISIILFFGENMNPPFYTYPVLIAKDAASVAFGDKSFKYLLFSLTGFTRSFKDTGFAFIDSLQ